MSQVVRVLQRCLVHAQSLVLCLEEDRAERGHLILFALYQSELSVRLLTDILLVDSSIL